MEKIKARLILEILGRPPEHVKEALNTLVVKMGSEKGIDIMNKKYHNPKELEGSKDLFTSFAEVDAEFESLDYFFAIIMGYMPSNIEIYDPEKFKLTSHEFNSLSSHIISKLHRYDEVTKSALIERNILASKLDYLRKGGKIEELIKQEKAQVAKNVTEEKKKAKGKNTKKKKSKSSGRKKK